ncbi:hypothetical protein Q8F55_008658 [Vanrija albida]|uniref:SGNH hydrolase-type esterase domain-containing protein n=1 Tax=Vanrija albida TaxID=181172 RepID=A0ABR3PRM4_9TREE
MRAVHHLRYARPALFFALVLGAVWLSGFALLLVTTDTLRSPVDAGRAWIDRFRTPPASQEALKADKRPRYAELCEALPGAAGDLRAIDDKWGRVALEMSVAHAGSGIRMRRALRRLVNHEPFTIAAIGGSITGGHGVNKTNGGEKYTDYLQTQLRKTYPNVTVLNVGIPGHGTDYFSNCYQLHAPTNADMYIIESAVNDVENANHAKEAGEQGDTIGYTELFVRQLLSNRPDNAVLMMSSFGSGAEFANAAHLHNVVSEYYDIPRLSMRIFMYPYMLQYPDERVFRFDKPDIRHPNEYGHMYMADILQRYLMREGCRAAEEAAEGIVPHAIEEYKPEAAQIKDANGKELPGFNPERVKEADKHWLPYPEVSGSSLSHSWDPFTLPSLRIKQNWVYGAHPRPEGSAFCQTTDVLADDGLPVMRPSKSDGWEHVVTKDKHYWRSDRVGAQITFDNIDVSAGIVSLFHLRCDQNYGNAKCWIDDKKDEAVEIVSTWKFICISTLAVVTEKASPGKHSLTCEISENTADKNGKHDFAIAAIISH